MYRFLSNLHPSTIWFWSFFLSFFCLPNSEDLRACRLTPPHLMRLLVIVLSNKRRCSLQTIHYFLKRCVIELPCMLDMYGFFCCFFSLCAWRCPFCRMTPAWHSYFIYELLTFLGQQQKSDKTPPPLVIYTSAFQLCWSAPPSAVIRMQWMRFAFLMEVDRRGSWCEGGKKRLHCSRNHQSLPRNFSLLF